MLRPAFASFAFFAVKSFFLLSSLVVALRAKLFVVAFLRCFYADDATCCCLRA